MPAVAKIPGFVSQRQFAQAMRWYDTDERADDSIIDPVSKELYSSGKQKGRKCEYLIAHMFKRMGYQAKVLKGQEGCDLLVKMNEKWMNVEVKASEFNKNYAFHRIKPNNFDMIVFVFVGKECTTVQIGGSTAKKFVANHGTWVVRDSAYTICFNRMRSHSKAQGKDGIWFSFTKKNICKLI